MNKANVRVIPIIGEAEARREISLVGADVEGVKLMAPKAVHRVIKLEGVSIKAANILKQDILSKGGDAAVARGVVAHSVDKTDVILMGTVKQLQQLCNKLRMQPFGLKQIGSEIKEALGAWEGKKARVLNCNGKELLLGDRTLVMGILNVTPDSFSDGGKFHQVESALERAKQMVQEGADIIDVGGESTRPTASPVDLQEELHRVVPIVEALVSQLEVPISIDTYKSEVAERCAELGVHMINDVWGVNPDPKMAEVVAKSELPYIIMHNQQGTDYRDLMGDIFKSFRESIAKCLEAGVKKENIIIDPGIGFGKTYEQNLEVMYRLEEFKTLGYPLLLGTSRKSIVGKTLDLPADQRIEGTGATVTLGIAKGADIVRIHDVTEMARTVKMTDAIVRRSF
ncbi:dihydropteroate synthase [Desulfitispora alkaliphila]|uniref:dihydropteroate synthase n=1 Tax=Desulfitispora alkaliphila TaxID=622674 RepID=UPI003D1D4156